MSDRPTGSGPEFSTSAPFFFLVANTSAVFLNAPIEIPRVLIADRLSHAFQPVPRPRKLDAQDGEANGNYDDGRTGRDEHNEPDQQHGNANHRYRYSTRDFIGEMDSLSDQMNLPKSLILRRAIVACIG